MFTEEVLKGVSLYTRHKSPGCSEVCFSFAAVPILCLLPSEAPVENNCQKTFVKEEICYISRSAGRKNFPTASSSVR